MENIPIPENFKKPTGFSPEMELADQSVNDWMFGGVLDGENKETTEFYDDLPVGESQKRGDRDKMTCTNNGGLLNPYQTLWNNRKRRGLFSKESIDWAREIGALDEKDKLNLSERFNAILSGTGVNGNSLKNPYEAMRKFGAIPEKMLPYVNDYGEYFDKSKITDDMRELGKEWLRHFPFNYEKVYRHDFKEVLKYSPIGVAGFAWPRPINGVYGYSSRGINHAFEDWAEETNSSIFDTYEESEGDYIKKLSPDYLFLHYGYRPIIREARFWKTPEDVEVAVNNQTYPPGTWLQFYFWWNGIFKKLTGKI